MDGEWTANRADLENMCLAVPGKLIEVIAASGSPRRGRVDFDGIIKAVDLSLLPEVKVGDYLVVHAGFAIAEISTDEALATLALLAELAEFDQLGMGAG